MALVRLQLWEMMGEDCRGAILGNSISMGQLTIIKERENVIQADTLLRKNGETEPLESEFPNHKQLMRFDRALESLTEADDIHLRVALVKWSRGNIGQPAIRIAIQQGEAIS
ncbi:OLC1v1001620C1 [Oldenlandia corymbosa var. corymbosa]|uniref:OLC1v1001620C1 n=1 Tax=Oldenlandia corymbosa var. corymbosa TaxID=529605 RepID=A0AAV1D5N0_OLDCO|nr:OLC1v1001620C1 [Oldenlandia corymbosa var. corymbosa]